MATKTSAKFSEKQTIQSGVEGATITPIPGRAKVYKVRLLVGRTAGKTHYATRTVTGLAEARRVAKELAAHKTDLQAQAGARAGKAHTTLGDAVARYLAAGKHSWTPKTYNTKQDRLQRRLVSTLGANTDITAITPLHIQSIQDAMLDSLAATTAKGAMLTIGAFFAQLVSWKVITDNPCGGVTPVRGTKPKTKAVWEPAQVEQALRDPACPLSVRLALVTGMRPEELQALTWQAIDLAAGTLHIEQVAYYDTDRKAWRTRTGAKTSTSLRTIALDRHTTALLTDAKGTKAGGYVITPKRLTGIVPLNSLRQELHRYAAEAGLPAIALYALRHSSITYLLAKGTPIKTVAQRAGHSNTATTLAHYAAATDSAALAAADLFDI